MFYLQPIFLGKTGTSTTSGGTTSSTGVAAAATRYTTSLALPEANDVLLVRLFFIRCFFIQPRTYRLIAMYFFFKFFQKFQHTVCPRFAGGVDGIDDGPVREIFLVHVGGTRRITSNITSSTDRNMNIQARITLTVECIHVFCYFYLRCSYNDE